MTRAEIDELIEYFEKNYHVSCEYLEPNDDSGLVRIRTRPTLDTEFSFPLEGVERRIIKQMIVSSLDKQDLIRF
jgi:hypothetical protein